MDAMLQRHCARYIYVIPDGLRELMSDISREVLRSQPEDTYTFIADYLDALMITRENARVAARLVQSLTEMATTTAVFLEETGMPRDEIDNIVAAIQKTFKKSIDSEQERGSMSQDVEEANVVSDILADIRVSPEQAEVAAIIIQQAYRRFKERKEREKELLAGMVDWRVAARSAIHLYRKTGVTNEEANRAATLIKAAYKGYYTRKLLKKIAALDQGYMQDFQLDTDYLEGADGDEGEFMGDYGEYDERTKSVKIDYNTVKPHVDFDTGGSQAGALPGDMSARVSTASTIAKHSIRYIFEEAFDRIARQSIPIPEEIAEEQAEERTTGAGSLVEQRLSASNTAEMETKQEVSEATDIDEKRDSTAAQPTPMDEPSETTETVEPTTDTVEPTTDTVEPTTDTVEPTTDTAEPTTETEGQEV